MRDLRHREALFRALVDHGEDAISLSTEDGTILYGSPGMARVLGGSPDELRDSRWTDHVVPEDHAAFADAMQCLLRGGAWDRELVFRVRRRDGAIRWLEGSCKNHLGDPELSAVIGSFHDVTARKLAEAALRKERGEAELGRRRLEAVLAALPAGVWITDAEGRIIETNPAAARIWGGAPPLVGLAEYGVYRAFWPETGELLRGEDWALARTITTGVSIVAEPVDIERFDGRRAHALNSTAPILDEDARVVGAVVVLLDVTEARAVAKEKESLVASVDFERQRLGLLLEKAPAFMAVLRGPKHVFERVNEAYYALTGHRELLGKPLLEALPELAGDNIEELLDRLLATGEPIVAEGIPLTLVRRPGAAAERRFVDFSCQALVEPDGTRSGVFVHGIDVTEAKVTQRRIRAQFDGVPVPTYVWQRTEVDGLRDFALLDFNAAAIAISNGAIEGHLGDLASRFFVEAPETIADLERCSAERITIQRETDWKVDAAGELRRLLVTYAVAPPDLVIVHTEDITQRVKLEQQLRQAQKMEAVGQLAGGVAHDFNNLMSVILNYGHLARESAAPEDPVHAHIGEILRAGARATELTRQLLAFSRRQVLQPRVLDLREVTSNLMAMLGRLLGESVELVLEEGRGAGRVLADRGQVEQVLMNLAMNARDAMPDGGRLDVAVADADDAHAIAAGGQEGSRYVVLSVADTGAGMDAATASRIFEPFFTTKEPGKGTGLGLSTVVGIVEQSGGHVSVESAPGRGSTFRVFLPRTEAAVAVKVPSERALTGGDETVLLVEDEPQLRAVAARVLRRSGYHVIEASNAGEALMISEARAETIDLLLTDVVMPRMSGSKLVERLSPMRPEMKILYMSGHASDALGHHGVLDPKVAFLQKPFTPLVLARKVRDVLDAEAASPEAPT